MATAEAFEPMDLVLPLECGGCGAPSTRWCDACAAAIEVKSGEPHLVTPRVDPGVPVFALGRYAGPRRQAIVALKEHGRRDLGAPLTRASAARRRGGDPVTHIARVATRADPAITVVPALRTRATVRDSVGLTGTARERNPSGRVRLIRSVKGPVLLVHDIVTTGATAREAVRTLHTAGAKVTAVLTLAHA